MAGSEDLTRMDANDRLQILPAGQPANRVGQPIGHAAGEDLAIERQAVADDIGADQDDRFAGIEPEAVARGGGPLAHAGLPLAGGKRRRRGLAPGGGRLRRCRNASSEAAIGSLSGSTSSRCSVYWTSSRLWWASPWSRSAGSKPGA